MRQKTPEHADSRQYFVNELELGTSSCGSRLVLSGIKTLIPRVKVRGENANAVAKFINNHKYVKKIFYPGLSSHPGNELAKPQQLGFGGIESLFCHLQTMTHASINSELREKSGINERVIRLSVGIEDVNDLIEDVNDLIEDIVQALNHVVHD